MTDAIATSTVAQAQSYQATFIQQQFVFRRFRQRLIQSLYRWYYKLPFVGRRAHHGSALSALKEPSGARPITAPQEETAANGPAKQQQLARHKMVTHLNQMLARSEASSQPTHSLSIHSKQSIQANDGKGHASNRLDQPDLIKSLADSAYVCKCQGRFGEAERLYKQVLTLSVRRFGELHLAIAPHLSELSALYCLQKRYADAEPLLSKALKIRKQAQVANHPDIGEVCSQLGEAHCQLQHYRAAESLLQSALEVFRSAYGPEHSRTKAAYSDLMKLIAIAIEAGKFEEVTDEPPPLDLDTLGETHSWAQPHWMKQHEPEEDYSWIKLYRQEKGKTKQKEKEKQDNGNR